MFEISELKGERIVISDFKETDTWDMANWGVHESALYGDYNFNDMTKKDFRAWYRMKTGPKSNHYYSVRNGDKMIAYFGVKDISWLLKKSILGIVLDPDEIEKGYGTEILSTFLPYYFSVCDMKKLDLEVAEFNNRAISLYNSMGFKKIGYQLRRFYTDDIDLEEEFKEYKDMFEVSGSSVYFYVMKMELKRENWRNR